jgi:hypothetical protein
VKERLLNDLVHRGKGFFMGGIYTISSSYSNQRLEINAGFNMLKSSFEHESGSYLINFAMAYRNNFRIAAIGDKTSLFLGGLAEFYTHQAIFENWDKNHFYWLTSYSIGLNSSLKYDLSSNRSIRFEIGLPVLSLLSRPSQQILIYEDKPDISYIVKRIHNDPSLHTLSNHFAFELTLRYILDMKGKKWQSIYLRCSGINNNINGSEKINLISHTIGYEIHF